MYVKKKYRLTNRQFASYFKTGQSINSKTVRLIFTPHSKFQAAIVVGKKIYPRAVDRNRIKRCLYPVLQEIHKTKEISGVYIFLIKPSIKKNGCHQAKEEIKELLAKKLIMSKIKTSKS